MDRDGAKLLCTPVIASFLSSSGTLESVRSIKVKIGALPLAEIESRGVIEAEEIRTYEASTRLDAVASAGFRVSRSKMSVHISKGDVKLNYA